MSEIAKLAPSYIRSIAPYVGGKPISDLAREMGLDPTQIVKLASNENPLGVSPNAHMAMMDAVDDIARYPDGNSVELRQAVSEKFKVAPEHNNPACAGFLFCAFLCLQYFCNNKFCFYG